MKFSDIQWTDHTFNPWTGCAKISAGCAHCYAETLADKRFGWSEWGPQGTRTRTSDANWRGPRRWNREAQENHTKYRVFCASLADVFEDRPELKPWREELHVLIRETPNLDWQLLTKRPEQAAAYYRENPVPANAWIGTSVENRAAAKHRIETLRRIPAAIRFLSCEPLLEDLGQLDLSGIDWVIVGGESGPGFRPIEKPWITSIRDQCKTQGVAFFFKQWGGSKPKKNGSELDGRHYREFPHRKS